MRSAAALAVAAVVVLGCGSETAHTRQVRDPDAQVTHEYVIPPGTNNRLAAGDEVTIVPQTLHVGVGDTIRIENQDDYGSQVGIFSVGAGETVTMEFTSPGRLQGACDVHPSGVFIIDVAA